MSGSPSSCPGRIGAVIAAGALLLAAPGGAGAQDRPALTPTRDVAVTYRTQQDGASFEQTARWSVAARRMRLDAPTPGLFVLLDYTTRKMDVVRGPDRTFFEMDAPAGLVGLSPDVDATYKRTGEDSALGIPCTDWTTVAGTSRIMTMCVTADGVTLRVREGNTLLAEASGVHYGPQDPAQFRVPDGFTRVEPPR